MPEPKKSAATTNSSNRRWLLALAAVTLLGLAALLFFSNHSSKPALQPGSADERFALADERQTFGAYGGSASCRECHAEAFDLWAKSHHGLAERLPEAKMEDAAFEPAHTFRHGTQQTSLRKSKDRYEMVTAGLKHGQEVFQVERIIGESPLRQLLVPFPGGRWQTSEASWDPRSNQWFNVFGEEDRRPGEWGHWTGRGMNWNTMCANCHNTRLRKNYDETNDVYHTAMVERGVGCEACHGPMKAHNDWQHANQGKSQSDPTLKKLSRDQMLDTCAACHSRRGEITGDPKPGDRFYDHHLLSIVDESDLFYPDGQVREEDYEFTAFLGSRMFHKGVRCVDCHDVHGAKVKLPGNLMCLTCHGPGQTNAPVIDPVQHSQHKVFGFDPRGVMTNLNLALYRPEQVKETGGECVNCHMPQTVYMQRHSRHDHGFTIPDPLLTKQFGIPNACNRCHQDKSADWSLKYVEKWYGDKMNRPYRRRAQILARAKNGDDSARDDLLKLLQTEEQPYWRAAAVNLLARWVNNPQVRSALLGKVTDTNALVRQSIVQTLSAVGEAGPPEVRAALQARLADSSRNVRVTAAQALAATLDLKSLAGSELLHQLNHNADQPAGQMQWGIFDFARGDVRNALKHFHTAARWDPFSPGIHHETAIALSQLGRPREALVELQEAVRLAPRDAEFRFELALGWNELGDSATALAELEAAVKLDPRHARAGYNLGLARNAAGDPAGAIQALLAAEAAEPGDARIPYARATIHAQLGQINEARQAARRALELNPQFPEAAALLQQLNSR